MAGTRLIPGHTTAAHARPFEHTAAGWSRMSALADALAVGTIAELATALATRQPG
ncbi:MAG TPA: hypothetical protein VGR11_06175 [Solirubrobacteraceae bacterium]|nr:hypothetical protein [Solirubrobacteraceae bacterium]